MSEREFWETTPRAFFSKLDKHYESELWRQRQDWERMRLQTAFLINIQLPKGKKIKPTELMPFEWDEKKQVKAPTKEEINRILKKHGEKEH